MSEIRTVGFVGIGNMGTPMTTRLVQAGYEVRGFDPSPEARERLVEAGGTAVGAILDLAVCDLVILMLPDSNVVESVLVGDGLLEAVGQGGLIVDMSSSEPLRTRELAERAAGIGVTFLDAPVSGGIPGAKAGKLAIMVGGPEGDFERVREVLSTFGPVTHVGAIGAGHALKALNNMLSAISLLASSEAMHVGIEFGLDPAIMLEVINRSSGRSGSTDNKWPNYILPGTYDAGFPAKLLLKDMRIAASLAHQLDMPMGLGDKAVDYWAEAVEYLGPTTDHTAIARWLEENRGALTAGESGTESAR